MSLVYSRLWALNKRHQVPVTLDVLHGCGKMGTFVKPALRLEFIGIIAPERSQTVHDGDGYANAHTFGDVNLICHRPVRELNGGSKRDDVIGYGLVGA
jgi:hypothetical protein